MDMATMRETIDHVVVLMLENRSFDNLLGWLYDTSQSASLTYVPPLGKGDPQFEGLAAQDLASLANSFGNNTVPPSKGVPVLYSPQVDPHEPYLHVNAQLFGSQDNPAPNTPATMKGFLADYATKWSSRDWDEDKDDIAQVMDCFMPAEAPVINGLAGFYGVSDSWFSSVPTQTNTNRAFANCGTSLGRTDNTGFLSQGAPFTTPTIWNAMEAAGKGTWRVYAQEPYPLIPQSPFDVASSYTQFMFPDVAGSAYRANFRTYQTDFFADVSNGDLPSYTFIEPKWTYKGSNLGIQGNDYHPPGGTTPGELFLKQVYQALSGNPDVWNKCLLIVTFDEHGGTYDHVPPPWGAQPPWGSSTPPFTCEHGFGFDRFGVRVPTVFISPWVSEGTVVRSGKDTPFDHTSIISTVLTWLDIPQSQWNLGQRVASAPTFESALNAPQARTDNLYTPVPVSGQLLGYGASFCLQHVETGQYIGAYEEYRREYYPLLSDTPVTLQLTNATSSGAVMSGDIVKLKTTESGVDAYDTLGAWVTSTWVYWYEDEDYSGKEQWQLIRTDGTLGPLSIGDEVYVVNTYSAFAHLWDGYGLQPDPKNPTWIMANRGRDAWRIVAAPGAAAARQ